MCSTVVSSKPRSLKSRNAMTSSSRALVPGGRPRGGPSATSDLVSVTRLTIPFRAFVTCVKYGEESVHGVRSGGGGGGALTHPQRPTEVAGRGCAGRRGLDRRHVRCLLTPGCRRSTSRPPGVCIRRCDPAGAVRRPAVSLRHPAAVVREELRPAARIVQSLESQPSAPRPHASRRESAKRATGLRTRARHPGVLAMICGGHV